MSTLSPSKLRRKQADQKLRAELQARSASRYAEHLSAEDAFSLITRRITWLNNKIDDVRALGRPYDLYLREREALLWMMDKVKELAEKLLRYESPTAICVGCKERRLFMCVHTTGECGYCIECCPMRGEVIAEMDTDARGTAKRALVLKVEAHHE